MSYNAFSFSRLVLVVAMFGNELVNHSIKSAKQDFGDIKEDTDKMKIQVSEGNIGAMTIVYSKIYLDDQLRQA